MIKHFYHVENLVFNLTTTTLGTEGSGRCREMVVKKRHMYCFFGGATFYLAAWECVTQSIENISIKQTPTTLGMDQVLPHFTMKIGFTYTVRQALTEWQLSRVILAVWTHFSGRYVVESQVAIVKRLK